MVNKTLLGGRRGGSPVPRLTFLGIGCKYEDPVFKLLPELVV